MRLFCDSFLISTTVLKQQFSNCILFLEKRRKPVSAEYGEWNGCGSDVILFLTRNTWMRRAWWQGAWLLWRIQFITLHRCSCFCQTFPLNASKPNRRTLDWLSGSRGWILSAQYYIFGDYTHGRSSRLVIIFQENSSTFEVPVTLEILHMTHCLITVNMLKHFQCLCRSRLSLV